jgi:hypothetical protein
MLFTSKLDLYLRKANSEMLYSEICRVLELGHFGKSIRNILTVLKTSAGEG